MSPVDAYLARTPCSCAPLVALGAAPDRVWEPATA